ncbi:MAG: patatin-like phospholipase family protein, partial [Chloroflexota bacterium]
QEQRRGVGLCLSGGGSRAALFELGVLRRLNEVGVLSQVDTISSVSGGSILAAHLATAIDVWPSPGGVVVDFEARVIRPFETFMNRNLRTAPLARRVLMPWNWLQDTTAIESLVELFETYLSSQPLSDLARAGRRPRFVFNASDNAFGVNWEMAADRMGSHMAGHTTRPEWSVARAAAASSCFPPLFQPMPIDLEPGELSGGDFPDGPERDELIGSLRLSDGGLYDNLALEPVWRDHRVVISVDGGATFDPAVDKGLIGRLGRYVSIMGEQVTAIRKRWLISNFASGVMDGAYLGIGSHVDSYETQGDRYPAGLVDDIISEVRTDLDAFDDAESRVLQNHGYLLAEAALKRHLSQALDVSDAAAAVPYPEFMDESTVRTALADSDKRRLLGRGPWLRYLFAS